MKRLSARLLSALLCAALLLLCVPGVLAYSNVSPWAQADVEQMETLGLLPDCLLNSDLSANITRGEMCKLAVRVYEEIMSVPASCAQNANYFSDTKEMEIYFAFEQGIVNGYDDGTFRPDDPLTRQDFFKITQNLMNSLNWHPGELELDTLEQFEDADQISPYALTPTRTMVTIGVVKGTGKALEPLAYTQRQAAIVMFLRAYNYVSDWLRENNGEPPFVPSELGFTGISEWAIQEFKEMYNLGLIPQSLSNVDMSTPITRAQMCSIAMLAYNKLTGANYTAQGAGYFRDTDEPDVNAAYELHIVDGYGDGLFGAADPLTREQFFRLAENFMSVIGYPTTGNPRVDRTSLSGFSDYKAVSTWATQSTRLMLYIGAVKGSDGKLLPQDKISCEEALVIFLRCYKFTVNWDGSIELPSLADDLVAYALTFEGYSYVYGGTTPAGFDCSGFVQYVYRHFGYEITRTATSQYYSAGVEVSRDELLPGDLVFFASGGEIVHVGLYIGDNRFIHAANSSRGVCINSLSDSWYNSRYYGAKRVIED